MNEIAIRHWDGYWFGKREMWGDVYPHYWSTLTAAAYHYYSQCTGDASYQRRAENIVRNNLCLFLRTARLRALMSTLTGSTASVPVFTTPLPMTRTGRWSIIFW